MLTNRKITTYADNIKDMSDTPSSDGITAPYLKAKFDGRTDKEIKDAINGIVDDLTSTTDGSSGADNISATPVYENGSSTSQGILEELKAKKIETANIISTITTAMREDKVPNEKAIYLIMEAIGAGDMVKSVYDPTNQAKDIFNELSILNASLSVLNNDRGYKNTKILTITEESELDNLENGKYRLDNFIISGISSTVGSWIIDITTSNGIKIMFATACWGTDQNGKGITHKRHYQDGIWQSWQEIATTETAELTLLNGWIEAVVYDITRVSRSGNICILNMRIQNGVTTANTIITNMPSFAIPNKNIAGLAINPTTGEVFGSVVIAGGTGELKILLNNLSKNNDVAINIEYSIK